MSLSLTLRSWAINILVLIMVLVFMLFLGEGFWRLFMDSGAPQRVWDPTFQLINPPSGEWTMKTSEYTTYIRSNSDGFRGPQLLDENDPSDAVRILFLGDSFVEALQVEEQDRFVELVQSQLSVALHKPVVARAIAIAKANPPVELLFYRELGKDFQPDIVVQVLFPENDLLHESNLYQIAEDENGVLHGENVIIDPPAACMIKCQILKHSRIALEVYRLLRRTTSVGTLEQRLRDYRWYRLDDRVPMIDGVRRMNAFVRTLRTEVQQDGAQFVTVLMPGAFEIQNVWRDILMASSTTFEQEWDPSALLDETAQELQNSGIAVLDLRPAFITAQPDVEPLYYRLDPHLNEKGHQVTADVLAQFLLDQGVDERGEY